MRSISWQCPCVGCDATCTSVRAMARRRRRSLPRRPLCGPLRPLCRPLRPLFRPLCCPPSLLNSSSGATLCPSRWPSSMAPLFICVFVFHRASSPPSSSSSSSSSPVASRQSPFCGSTCCSTERNGVTRRRGRRKRSERRAGPPKERASMCAGGYAHARARMDTGRLVSWMGRHGRYTCICACAKRPFACAPGSRSNNLGRAG